MTRVYLLGQAVDETHDLYEDDCLLVQRAFATRTGAIEAAKNLLRDYYLTRLQTGDPDSPRPYDAAITWNDEMNPLDSDPAFIGGNYEEEYYVFVKETELEP